MSLAMAHGVPVVGTPLAFEGVPRIVDGVHALVATSAGEFADDVLEMMSDCHLWTRVRDAGYRLVQQHEGRRGVHVRLVEGMRLVGVGPREDVRCGV